MPEPILLQSLHPSDFNDSDDHLRIRHVMELRQRYRGSSDPAGLDELRRGETEAATHFLAAGSALAREGRYQEAIEKYEMGLLAQPANAELQQARQTAAGRKEVWLASIPKGSAQRRSAITTLPKRSTRERRVSTARTRA